MPGLAVATGGFIGKTPLTNRLLFWYIMIDQAFVKLDRRFQIESMLHVKVE